ncbi:iron-containing alcohol dehydrogenase [Rhizobium halophytocola]|uniref:Alcohol dehydrogenase class IV n=1 Tax=Rhizobium halophytocola TaxID=735519 RepID=A0ABS4E2T8_9HYPH|nr:iron-containing alcohol dehydrogenase [Rhizobium halophytocola]MBP1852231.1 alcohol dehydrogenase class IV [Rhizobium halophytocola]
MSYCLSSIPEIHVGSGTLAKLADVVAAKAGAGPLLLVIDTFLDGNGIGDLVRAALAKRGIEARLFSDFAGEPKIAHLRAAQAAAEGARAVIGIGGGSALDIAKITACTAVSGKDPMHYALAAHPLPTAPLLKIMVPTTAGTGSETSATNIFSGPTGKKLWIWGPETKADAVILDAELTVSLPAHLTAWCGLDAFIHAFEASTNRNTHAGAQVYGHQAMRLIAANLERAVSAPDDLVAREAMLVGSCLAGIAIDNCGTAIAHNVSHALAGLGPVHHGLATALGFEATIAWLCEEPTPALEAAASVCGLRSTAELPDFVAQLMDRCGIRRALPPVFSQFAAEDLAAEMKAPENQPMRRATACELTDADLEALADRIMALPKE